MDDGRLVRLERVTKKYVVGRTEILAVDGVDLTLEAGSFTALVGRSGSGKSTLMHLIGGLDRPMGGEVVVDGRRLSELSDRELALFRRSTVAFVFQFYNLIPALSALKNVELPMALAGVGRSDRRRRAARALEQVGLADRGSHSPAKLSGGEQQRVAIARALVNAPRLLLADEPTGNLDTRTAGEILDLFGRLNADGGLTILMVTHDLSLAGRAARRTIHMSDGKVSADERD
jgi:putative ABC transport system ATP-binding protein